MEFISFWHQLGSPLGMKIPRDSFSGIPLRCCWRLGINSFCRQLGSLLEFSRWHFGNNSVWHQIGSPFGICDFQRFLLGIPPCFPLLGFTLLIRLCGTTFSPVGGLTFFSFLEELHQSPKEKIDYVLLDPVANYVHVLDLNARLHAGWKILPN